MNIEKVVLKTPSFDITEVRSFASMQAYLYNKYDFFVKITSAERKKHKLKAHDIQEYMDCEFGYNEYDDLHYYFFRTQIDAKRFVELMK